jgi:hypothetical protein
MVWVGGAVEGVKNGSFGGHGRSFVGCHLTIGSSDHGAPLRWAKEGIDDRDKAASIDASAAPRRSSATLASISDSTAGT